MKDDRQMCAIELTTQLVVERITITPIQGARATRFYNVAYSFQPWRYSR